MNVNKKIARTAVGDRFKEKGFDVHACDATPDAAFVVRKHGCEATIAMASAQRMIYVAHPRILRDGEPAQIVDCGYQKFLRTKSSLTPIRASELKALRIFSEELSALMEIPFLFGDAHGAICATHEYPRMFAAK